MRTLYWRRRLGALALAAVVVGAAVVVIVLATGTGGGPGAAGSGVSGSVRVARPPAPPQLPRGGRAIFPHFRVVAFYGAPQAASLGELGIGTPAEAAAKLAKQARPYRAGGRPELPAMELIADVANSTPGDDGLYRTRQPDAIVARYLRAARRAKDLLILDIQPGHAGFLTEAEHLEKWLRQPDVSLALDPEWHLPPDKVPGTEIGSVTAREINAVSFWLAGIVKRHDLPQKLLVVHRFTPDMISDEPDLKTRPGIALTLNVDGFGGSAIKVSKYDSFAYPAGSPIHNGFKLFYHEDTGLMTPGQVLAMTPRPELVVYE